MAEPVNITGYYSKIISRPHAGLFLLIYIFLNTRRYGSTKTVKEKLSQLQEGEYLLQISLNKINRGPESKQSASNLLKNSSALLNLSLLCFINLGNLKPSILQNRNVSFTMSFLLWMNIRCIHYLYDNGTTGLFERSISQRIRYHT